MEGSSGECRKFKNRKVLGFLGMRVVKTALAAYVCFLISLFRGTSPFYSTIAAIISMKSDHEESLTAGQNRIRGTLLGGFFGLITILLINTLKIEVFGHTHYLLLSLILIPIIYMNIRLNSPSSTTISCVVFLSIAISHIEDSSAFSFALNRTFETSLGVMVAVIINRFL